MNKNVDRKFFRNKSYILSSLTDMCYKKYLDWKVPTLVYDRGSLTQATSSADNDENEKRKVQILLLIQIFKHTIIILFHGGLK